jgi:hypothetical protein
MEPLATGSYSKEEGLRLRWLAGYSLGAQIDGSEIVIRANPEGLRSLAGHLLTLADDSVPSGVHAHWEPLLELDDDSVAMVVEKVD